MRPSTSADAHERFESLSMDLWTAYRWVRDRDVISDTAELQLAYLSDESTLRDLTTEYACALDAKDATLATSLFAEDSMLIDGRGQPIRGRTAIDAHHRADVQSVHFTARRMTNYLVRVTPDRSEAWLTAYFHTARTADSGDVQSLYGRHLGRFVRVAGRWRFASWTAVVDFVDSYGSAADCLDTGLPISEPPQARLQSRASAAHKNPLANGGRSTWHELRDDVWNAHHWLLDQHAPEPSASRRLTQLIDEVSIRELLSNYAYAHDSRDLSWTGSCFADRAMLINENWIYDGNAKVIDAFRGWNRTMLLSFHRFSNPIVKFVPENADAWLMAYFHVATVREDRSAYGFGRYFARLTKASGRWQIVDWRIANDSRSFLLPGTALDDVTGGAVQR